LSPVDAEFGQFGIGRRRLKCSERHAFAGLAGVGGMP
jgi:hypothetical protein